MKEYVIRGSDGTGAVILPEKGATVGADADLVCFDDDINVSAVYLMGKEASSGN